MEILSIIRNASECLAEGNAALGSEYFVEAIMAFRAGLRILGDDYLEEPRTLDSTPTRIVLAKSEERQGKNKTAAYLLHSALETRISIMRGKQSKLSRDVLLRGDR